MPDEREPGFVRVDHEWTAEDRRNAFRSRIGRFGPDSVVAPGLFALGRPDASSPVLATASSRLTFDVLRRDLRGVDCWLLVLDTRGLDVGSAAATGRFSTDELVTRLTASRLARAVSHRTLIVPARAARAIDGNLVSRGTGFEVRVGPERAADVRRFLADSAGGGAPDREAPRRVTLGEAAALVPMVLGRSLMRYPGFAFAALLLGGLGPGGVSLERSFAGAWPLLLLGLAAVLCGSALVPLVRAILPGVPLWVSGTVLGAAATGALLEAARLSGSMDPYLRAACWLFFPGASALAASELVHALSWGATAHPRSVGRLPAALGLADAGVTVALLGFSIVHRLGTGG